MSVLFPVPHEIANSLYCMVELVVLNCQEQFFFIQGFQIKIQIVNLKFKPNRGFNYSYSK